MQNNSREIVSPQNSLHKNLYKVLQRHDQSIYLKPVSRHTEITFKQALNEINKKNKPLIFDSGCGTGESTYYLARKYQNHFVIGIDKSKKRLSKATIGMVPANVLFVRADLFDFWRLAVGNGLKVDRHFILYPNPWPKSAHLKRRFHGHPTFFDLLQLGGKFELRSNWPLYLQEFAVSLKYSKDIDCKPVSFFPVKPFLSAFEKKYALSGQKLYRLVFDI